MLYTKGTRWNILSVIRICLSRQCLMHLCKTNAISIRFLLIILYPNIRKTAIPICCISLVIDTYFRKLKLSILRCSFRNIACTMRGTESHKLNKRDALKLVSIQWTPSPPVTMVRVSVYTHTNQHTAGRNDIHFTYEVHWWCSAVQRFFYPFLQLFTPTM